MSTHTAGPWTHTSIAMDDGEIKIKRVWDDEQGRRCTRFLAGVYAAAPGGEAELAEREANARLISAAPDLLAALKAVVRIADRKTVEFDVARAAIAKAEAP